MDINYIINKWTEFTNFDINKKHFNLNSWEYTFHKYNEKILKLSKEYNLPDSIVVLYIKNLFFWFTKECKITLADYLNKVDILTEVKELYDLFSVKEIVQIENEFYDKLNYFSSLVYKDKKNIGNMNLTSIVEHSLDVIFDELLKCNVEVYYKDGPLNSISYIDTNIHIFNTCVECINVLQKKKDGLYICYISNHNTSDGYFGFFIKSNNNLLSVNERVVEAFIGQHQNGRNHRFVEQKTEDLFPYELLSGSNCDYLGYYKNYTLKNEDKDVTLKDLSDKSYICLIMTIFLLNLRFSGKKIEQPCVYSNFILDNNLKNLSSYKENDLMIINNNLILKESQKEVNKIISKLNTDNILSGQFNNELAWHLDCEKKHTEVGEFHNNIFIDLYGNGFELDTSKILIDNSIKKLNSSEDDLPINAEFIGTENELFLQAYMGARQQLADYIQKNMNQEYEKFKRNFGSISKWYELRLQKYKSRIIKWVVQQYVNYNYNNQLTHGNWKIPTKNINVTYDENTNWSSIYNVTYPFRQDICYDYCMVNGKKVNCVITIRMNNYKDLEMILGEEVPKIIKGWETDGRRYNQNPLLNAVDPVCMLQTPFESRGMWAGKDYFTFAFAIGFSKSGLKKYIKDNNIVPEIENIEADTRKNSEM